MTETATFTENQSSETEQTLAALLQRQIGKVPPDFLVGHVMAITAEADWPTRRAAAEAILRRWGFAKRDGLRVSVRPPRGAVFGLYRTRRARSDDRPYDTVLERLVPLRCSCGCPDFARGSLGLCKHVLTVIQSLARHERIWNKALKVEPLVHDNDPHLKWDPVRPLTGAGDWLARVQLRPGAAGRLAGRAASVAHRWLRPVPGGVLAPRSTFADQPRRRLELVGDLIALLEGKQRLHDRIDPALRTLLHNEQQRLAAAIANRALAGSFRKALASMKRSLYPYQVQGVQRVLETGRLLLADDMGLGKTAQAIAACHALWHARQVRRGLLIVPASLKFQWQREWELFTDAPVAIVEGAPTSRAEAYDRHPHGFLIVNYEQVLRDLPLIKRWQPDIIVLDEAQRIKNWATKTAACVKQLNPPRRLVLTGTPMENRIEELASIMDWVDECALEPKWRLTAWHTIPVDGHRAAAGARHLDTLRERLAPSMLRRVRKDVLDQLPSRTDTIVPVELTPAQDEEHEALSQPIARLVSIAKRRPLTQEQFLRLMSLLTTQRIIANGLAQLRFAEHWPRLSQVSRPDVALLRSLDSPKLLELREILSQVSAAQGRKVVVFSQWRRMLRLAAWAVSDVLSDAGLRAAFFTGEESQKQRSRNLVDFHDDPATGVLFATDAGGVGLNLQRAANCCVNLDLPWNPAVLEQRVGRIHRLGQKHPIEVYHLVSQNCIESRLAALISDKQALFKGLFDGDGDEVRFESATSFMSMIARITESPSMPTTAADDDELTAEAAQRDIDALLEASDERQDRPTDARPVNLKPDANRGSSLPPADHWQALFSQLQVRATPQGGVQIEAPPQAAAHLAALFEGMAKLLRAGTSA